MRRIAGLLVLLLALCAAGRADAREEILSFLADVEVGTDGALTVTETIRVRAEGGEIRRGIYRDIPVRALDDWGLWSKNGFDILSVRRDGRDEPYHTASATSGIRIYIGEQDVFVPTGVHTYEITYRTTRQLRYFAGYDEIYWNATGNYWVFPILEARARIRLPAGATALQQAAYTGAYGSTGGDYRVSGEGTRTVEFVTTRPLRPFEGLTVAVGFTKGVVAGESLSGGFMRIVDNPGAILFGFGWIGVAGYFLLTWWRVGRDPPGETVIPLYHPPEDLSPAAMSYVYFQTFQQARRGSSYALIAALLSLGVKKYLKIVEDERDKVRFVRGPGGEQPLSRGEKALYGRLFAGGGELPLNKTYGPRLITANAALQGAITTEYGDKFFRHHVGAFVIGVIAAIAVLVPSMILQRPPDEAIGSIIPTLVLSLFGWLGSIEGWRMAFSKVPGAGRKARGAIMGVGGTLALLVALLVFAPMSQYPVYRIAGLMIFLAVGGIVAFRYLLRAPTVAGARVMSRIEGFKLYLDTAETQRLNMRDAPEMSEELFERYLPYAAGLGVEEPWSRAFASHLSRMGLNPETAYHPGWYSGRHWSTMNFTRATTGAMSNVTRAMAAAMPAPKSSSGSGGGGFSGGGGGGGGGGGW